MNEFLEKTIIPQKRGRITIPVEFRRKLGIDENTPLHLKLVEDRIEIKLVPRLEEDRLLRKYSYEQILGFLGMEVLDDEAYERIAKTIRIWPEPSPIPRLFLDTSVLLAMLDVNVSYSRLILELCRQGKAQALLTEVIIRETEQAVQEMKDGEMLARFYAVLAELDAEIVPLPRAKVIEMVDHVVENKHSHVLSSAWAGGANYILSLDWEAFLSPENREHALPSRVRTPREFVQQEIPV
jgi:AbrB family looped-hinge helix DNA binding protein